MEHSKFSRLGFIIAASGSAVGLGNIWKFPFTAGENGGGSFIIIYILCSLLIGIPVMIMEFTIGKGKAEDKGIVNAYASEAKSSFVKIAPIFGGLAALFIISFYCIVVGWIFKYLGMSIMGDIPSDPKAAGTLFGATASGEVTLGLALFFFSMVVNYFIVDRGLVEGIEKVSKIFMSALLVIFLFLFAYSLSFDGSSKAISYMFDFDWSKINLKTIEDAAGQAFFSLSLGAGTMVAYSLGMKDDQNIVSSAVIIAVIDTLIAIFAGIVVFAFVFEFGGSPTAGPGLIFVVLPGLFNSMGSIGYIVSILFFVLFLFAALTSSISLLQASSSMLQSYGVKRGRAVSLMTISAMMLGTLALLSINKDLGESLKIFGMPFFDFLDFLAEKIGMEASTLIGSILVGWQIPKESLRERFQKYTSNTIFEIWHTIIKFVIPLYSSFLLIGAFM